MMCPLDAQGCVPTGYLISLFHEGKVIEFKPQEMPLSTDACTAMHKMTCKLSTILEGSD